MRKRFAAFSLVVASVPAQDPIEALLQRAAALPHVSAEYTMSMGASSEPATIAFDYVAPGRMRLLRREGDQSYYMWCIDGVISTHIDGPQTMVGATDVRQIAIDAAALAARVRQILPTLSKAADGGADAAANASWRMAWGFDEGAGQATFDQGAMAALRPPAPFGWLETLRARRATLSEAGDAWKATTDGRFDIVVDAATGLLRSFHGRGAKGELSIALLRAEFATPPPAERFVVPSKPEGAAEIGDGPGLVVRRIAEEALRTRIYQALAAADGPFAGDAAVRAAGETRAQLALREFCAATMQRAFGQMAAMVQNQNGRVVQRVVAQRDAGRSAEQLAAMRSKVAASIAEALAPEAAKLASRASMPDEVAKLPFAAEALAAERAVVEALFRERVVDVSVAAFQKACDEALQ